MLMARLSAANAHCSVAKTRTGNMYSRRQPACLNI